MAETRKIIGTLTERHPAWFFPYDKGSNPFIGIILSGTVYEITLPTHEVYTGMMRENSPFLQENNSVLLEYAEGSEQAFKESGKTWVDIVRILPFDATKTEHSP